MSAIPKIVHRVWFGQNPIPAKYEKWWQAWQRQWPDHQFVTWTDSDIPKLPLVADKIALGRNFAEKSDIARYEIIRQFGGIYLDCDIMPLYPLDISGLGADLIRNPIELKDYEDQDGVLCHGIGCGNEFFAASPQHPALEMAVALLRDTDFPQNPELIDTVKKTGPFFWGKVVKGQGYELPENAISPYFYEEPFSVLYERDLSHAYGVHVWGNSWIPPDFHKYKLDILMDYGDLRAIEAQLPKTNISQDDYDQRIREIVSIRDARYHITEAALHSARLGNLILAPVNRELYHPFKVFFYLANERTKYDDGACRIWHLGACHPALARELRPILVNFDPDCVMIDSNTQALDQLQASYANNRNARFLLASIEDTQSLSPNNPPEALVLSTPDKNLELLDAFMQTESKPRIIILSQDGISNEDWANLYARLPIYRVIYFDGFACAYRKDWFLYFSSFLFIDHGIAGIFTPLAEKIFATARPEA